MKREVTATGATIDEAIEKARLELGISDDVAIEHEIIDLPEKKILGIFGGKPAKVTVCYDDGKPEPKRSSKPRAEKPVKEKPAKAEKTAQPTSKPAVSAKKQDKPVKAEKSAKKDEKPAASIALNQEALDRTVSYVKAIIAEMRVGEFTCSISDVEGGFCINIDGTGMGALIGRRGETLDAVQYLASLCYNNSEDGYTRVVVDTNNYRQKREETLTELANKVAERAKRTGHNQALEPMNPYERRVIHTAVQNIEGMTSWSVSDGIGRKVVIGAADEQGNPLYPNERPRGKSDRNDRQDRYSRGGRGRDNRRGGRGARSSYAAPAPTREKRSDATDLPLFGKIN